MWLRYGLHVCLPTCVMRSSKPKHRTTYTSPKIQPRAPNVILGRYCIVVNDIILSSNLVMCIVRVEDRASKLVREVYEFFVWHLLEMPTSVRCGRQHACNGCELTSQPNVGGDSIGHDLRVNLKRSCQKLRLTSSEKMSMHVDSNIAKKHRSAFVQLSSM